MRKVVFLGLVCWNLNGVVQNVGIGSIIPGAKLHVVAADSAVMTLHNSTV